MPRDINKIISEIQDVIMALEIEHNEMMAYIPDDKKSKVTKISTEYIKNINHLQESIKMRDQKIETLENQYRDLKARAIREMKKRDDYLKELVKSLPQSESNSLQQKFESSTEDSKDSSWMAMFGALNPFMSKSHNKPAEAYKLNIDGSSGEHEAGTDLVSSITDSIPTFKITKSDIDIIPMNTKELREIDGNIFKVNAFKDQFKTILFNLQPENVDFLKKKYHIEQVDIGNIKIVIKKIAFQLNLLTSITVHDYQSLREMEVEFHMLPDFQNASQRTKKLVAEGLSKMSAGSRTVLMIHLLTTFYDKNFTKLKEDALIYSLIVPSDIEDDKVFTYFQEV
jgi:hypothetical protein